MRRGLRRLNGDRGTANALIIVAMTGVMILAAGLAFDGSRVLAARREAVDVANQAARAGAQAVSAGKLRAGAVGIDPNAAVGAAEAFLAATSHRGSASVTGDEVVVMVSMNVRLPLLAMAGLSTTTVTGRGAAHIVRGISEAGA
jgi:Putative Flp pilus-assembly TadE/G-like